ncbi:hypothetical protein PR048_032661, partial [Dryococelus australis]
MAFLMCETVSLLRLLVSNEEESCSRVTSQQSVGNADRAVRLSAHGNLPASGPANRVHFAARVANQARGPSLAQPIRERARRHQSNRHSISSVYLFTVSKQQRRNARVGKTGDREENPLASGSVRRDSHMRKSGSDPARNRTFYPLHRHGPCTMGEASTNELQTLCLLIGDMNQSERRTASRFTNQLLPRKYEYRRRRVADGLRVNIVSSEKKRRRLLVLKFDSNIGVPGFDESKSEGKFFLGLRRGPATSWNSRTTPGGGSATRIRNLEVSMEHRPNAKAGETGDPRENRPISGTIPTCENPGVTPPGIEPGLPWWEASSLTTATTLPRESKECRGRKMRWENSSGPIQTHDTVGCDLWNAIVTTLHPEAVRAGTVILFFVATILARQIYSMAKRTSKTAHGNDCILVERFRRLLTSRSSEPMRVTVVGMEQRRNEGAGETGDPRENPPTNGIVRHDSHMRKSGVTRPCIEPGSHCTKGPDGSLPPVVDGLSRGQRGFMCMHLPAFACTADNGENLKTPPSTPTTLQPTGVRRRQRPHLRLPAPGSPAIRDNKHLFSFRHLASLSLRRLLAAAAIPLPHHKPPPFHKPRGTSPTIHFSIDCSRPPVAQSVGAPPVWVVGGSGFESRQQAGVKSVGKEMARGTELSDFDKDVIVVCHLSGCLAGLLHGSNRSIGFHWNIAYRGPPTWIFREEQLHISHISRQAIKLGDSHGVWTTATGQWSSGNRFCGVMSRGLHYSGPMEVYGCGVCPGNGFWRSVVGTPTRKFGGGGVMVWGFFMAFDQGPFVRSIMNTETYCNILDNEMLPTLWRFYGMDPCYFQYDNARRHPTQSHEPNPIEHLWDEFDSRVKARQALPKSIAQLMELLQEEWRRIPVAVLQTLVESMPDRVAAVIVARVVVRHTARERAELGSANEDMEFTCSEYWDMAMAMGASGDQAPCMLHVSNMCKSALLWTEQISNTFYDARANLSRGHVEERERLMCGNASFARGAGRPAGMREVKACAGEKKKKTTDKDRYRSFTEKYPLSESLLKIYLCLYIVYPSTVTYGLDDEKERILTDGEEKDWRVREGEWGGTVIEVSMEQRRNEGTGEAGYFRENQPTNGIVQHDSHMRKSGLTPPGIKPGSPWWEANRLTAQPPWPREIAYVKQYQSARDMKQLGSVVETGKEGLGLSLVQLAVVSIPRTLGYEPDTLVIWDDFVPTLGWSGVGVPRENPPPNGVQHDSRMRKSGTVPAGYRTRISPWWEASALATAPPLTHTH